MVIAQTKTLYLIGVFDAGKKMKYSHGGKNEEIAQNQGHASTAIENCQKYLVSANC